MSPSIFSQAAGTTTPHRTRQTQSLWIDEGEPLGSDAVRIYVTQVAAAKLALAKRATTWFGSRAMAKRLEDTARMHGRDMLTVS
jgi:hypothetical protein